MIQQRGVRPQWRRFVLPVACATLAFLAGCGGTGTGSGGSNAPLVNGALPPAGSPAGGTFVTLSGAGFLDGVVGPTSVTFAGLPAGNVTVVDDNTITLTTPAHGQEATVDIQVINSRGTGTLSSGFQYLATASILSDLNTDGIPDIAIGATQDASAGFASGAVFVFYGTENPPANASQMASDADLVIVGAADGDRFGATVQTGDVNADGHHDLLVGSPWADGAVADTGVVSIFLGPLPASGVLGAASADIVLSGEGTGSPGYGNSADAFGSSISLGDANGDAVLDILVGSPGVDVNSGQSNEIEDAGRGYLFLGGAQLASGTTADAVSVLSGVRENDKFATEVCLIDVNGDGQMDVASSFDVFGSGALHSCRVGVFTQGLPATATSDDADVLLRSTDNGDRFGYSMSCGDFDQDGIMDLTIGAPFNSEFASGSGRVFVFLGQAGFTSMQSDEADVIFTGGFAGMRFGERLASADVNGDGVDDVLASAPFASWGALWNGQVFVFNGGAGMVDAQAQNSNVIITGEAFDGERFGSALEVLDADMDGTADVLSSATGHGAAKGRVYVFHGEETLLDADADQGDMTLTGESEAGSFGSSISRGK